MIKSEAHISDAREYPGNGEVGSQLSGVQKLSACWWERGYGPPDDNGRRAPVESTRPRGARPGREMELWEDRSVPHPMIAS